MSLDGSVTLSTMISPGTVTEIPGKVWHPHLALLPGKACRGLVHTSLAPDSRQLMQTLMSRSPLPVLSMHSTGMF